MSNSYLSTNLINLKSYSGNESNRSESHCSCSQCGLDDCFKLRNQYPIPYCTCHACKQAIKTVSDKTSVKEIVSDKTHLNTISNITTLKDALPNKTSSEDTDCNNTQLKDSTSDIAPLKAAVSVKSSLKEIVPDKLCLNCEQNRKDRKSKIKSKINEIQKEIFPEITDTEFSGIDNDKYTEYRCKDVSLKKDKIDWNTEKKAYEKCSTRQYIHSVAITYLPKEKENSTVKLSAQIMDMPYDEVKDSLLKENSDIQNIENKEEKNLLSPNFTDIKPDILTRLKEIYKACSCKVCECIFGQSLTLNNESCGCTPCDCKLCTNNIKIDDDFKPPPPGCPCVKCDRKDCRGVVKNTGDENCDCKPCECVKCVDNLPKSCSCVPCQCTECIALGLSLPRSIVVAPVQGSVQQNMCQCEPCECDNCTHNYTAMASNSRREISTNIDGNCPCDSCLNDSCQMNSEICRCNMEHKVMKKPLAKTTPDYDIHRTVIYRDRVKKTRNQDTIAMYALSNNFSNLMANSKINCINCHCLECECFVCNRKHKYESKYEEVHCKVFENDSELHTDSSSICKCSPCDCEICNRSYKRSNELGEKCFHKYCECNKCDCLICRGLLQYSNNNRSSVKIVNRFFKEIPFSPSQKKSTPKKGKIFTPSMFEAHIRSESKLKNRIDKEYLSVHKNKSLCTKLSRHKTVTVCHTESKHNTISYETNIHNTGSCKESQNSKVLKSFYPVDKQAGGKIFNLKRNILLKNNSENIDPITSNQIISFGNRTPIRDFDLLNECIYLAKSNSKIVLETNANISIKNSQNFTHETLTSKLCSNNSIPNYEIQNNVIKDFNDEIVILNKDPSKSIMLCDKKLSIEFKNQDFVEDYTFDKMLEKKSDDSIKCNRISSNELIVANPRKDVFESVCYKDKHAKLSKYVQKSNLKSKSNYNKMYRRFLKNSKDKVANIIIDENINKDDTKKDILSIIENLTDNLASGIRNFDNLALDTSHIPPVKNFLQTEDVFINKMDEDQNIDEGDGNKLWSILRKNLYLSCTHIANNKSVCTVPVMEMDIKKAVEAISIQTSGSTSNTKSRSGKQALAQLLIEVKKLLSSPFLQSRQPSKEFTDLGLTSDLHKNQIDIKYKSIYSDAISQTIKNRIPIDKETNCNLLQPMESLYNSMKQLLDLVLSRAAYKSEIMTTKYNLTHECTEEIQKINSVKSSCDGLKAAFIGLRTISDHTVMVKWKLPRQVVYVQGYELQVDGRPVQKIFSPTRCMAILTCLPHTDKLLLTIRTLTDNSPSDHNPASTIVYRPRVK